MVDGYGSPSDLSSGTSYLLLHSGYRGEAVGDYLTDRSARESHLTAGDRFYVDGVEYEVVSEAVHSKSALEGVDTSGVPLVPEVWEDVDGRLHLMTCLQRPEGRSADVLVVTAQAVV